MPIPHNSMAEVILGASAASSTSSSPQQAERQTMPGIGLLLAALVPFALGYFFSYLYRAVNAVVAPDLVKDLGLSAGELGLLTSAYLFAFSLFQLPLGILLDRYGPRRVQAALVALGGIGALLFSIGNSTLTLTLARAIIGIGFAGGLMSGFKAIVIWVPEQRRALANACVMSVGAVGLLVSTAPMQMVAQAFGWRTMFAGLGIVTLVVAVVIQLVVPERPATRAQTTLRQEVNEVVAIFSDRVFLALVPLPSLTAGVHIAIQTLWAGPWFRDVAGLDRTAVAGQLFAMAAAFFVGILVSGAIADWFVRRGASLLDVMLGFLAFFFVAQICLILQIRGADLLIWCVFGMTGQVAVLCYPWLSSYFGAHLSGRANTAVNLLMFSCAFATQYGIGAIIDLYPSTAAGKYPPEAYRMAFLIAFGLQIATLAWFLLNRRLMQRAEEIFRKSP